MITSIQDTLTVARGPSSPSSFSRAYWDATREKKILLQFDGTSGRFQFYPRATSIFTGRRNALEWREVKGQGEIFTFTVIRSGLGPFKAAAPFFIATVTLEEGVRVIGNVVDCGFEQMRIGLRVAPHFSPLPDGTHMLMFRPEQ